MTVGKLISVCVLSPITLFADFYPEDPEIAAQRPERGFRVIEKLMKVSEYADDPFTDINEESLDLYLALSHKHLLEFYRWRIVGNSYEDYKIMAIRRNGGRSFCYNPRWRRTHLVFRDDEDRNALARLYSACMEDLEDTDAINSLVGLLSIPWIRAEGSASIWAEVDKSMGREILKRQLAIYGGDFCTRDVSEIIFQMALFDGDGAVRLNLLESIGSAFSSFPPGVQMKLKKALETAPDRRLENLEEDRLLKSLALLAASIDQI